MRSSDRPILPTLNQAGHGVPRVADARRSTADARILLDPARARGLIYRHRHLLQFSGKAMGPHAERGVTLDFHRGLTRHRPSNPRTVYRLNNDFVILETTWPWIALTGETNPWEGLLMPLDPIRVKPLFHSVLDLPEAAGASRMRDSPASLPRRPIS